MQLLTTIRKKHFEAECIVLLQGVMGFNKYPALADVAEVIPSEPIRRRVNNLKPLINAMVLPGLTRRPLKCRFHDAFQQHEGRKTIGCSAGWTADFRIWNFFRAIRATITHSLNLLKQGMLGGHIIWYDENIRHYMVCIGTLPRVCGYLAAAILSILVRD